MELKFGCDPEFFLINGAGDSISAYGLFPGTKDKPYKLDRGAVQVDGLALEFNIDPVSTEDEFNKNISVVLTQINEMIQKVDKELTPVFSPVKHFKDKYFENIPDNAKVLGCDPDWNYLGDINPAPEITNQPVRTAAGHIHIGWTNGEDPKNPLHFEDCRFIAERFYRSQVFAPKTRGELERLKYYGGNGSFRPKTYGVEIRSPSNVWVAQENTRREIFRKTSKTMQEVINAL